MDYSFYKEILGENKKEALQGDLVTILSETTKVPELDLNPHVFSRLKKAILTKFD